MVIKCMRKMMKWMLIGMMLIASSCFAETLFVCTGNTGRSYMAEVLANKKLYHDSFSRVINVKTKTPEKIVTKVLSEWNIKQTHTPQQIQKSDLEKANLILTMTAEQKKWLIQQYPVFQRKILTLSECATGKNEDILDAYQKKISFYRKSRNQIFKYEEKLSSRRWLCTHY